MTKPRRTRKTGKVYLVGAGPGDIGLFTLRGKECMEKADVIIYDYLANEGILAFAHSDAKRIFMGKHGGGPIMPQEETNRLMVSEARKGKIVVRLKGGDPFIFGRGGEEAEFLARNRIPFELVPGVSAGSSVPAYAGIPLSHRNYSSTIAFITGHENAAKKKSSIDWEKIATGIDTMVIFMGITRLSWLIAQLTENGRSPHTPIAVIQWGTTDSQKTVTGTLLNIAGRVRKSGIRPPGIIVVGEVVRLRKRLRWFRETAPEGRILRYTFLEQKEKGLDILIAAGPEGVCRVMFGKETSLVRELRSEYDNTLIIRDDRFFENILIEFNNYFRGIPTRFTCNIDMQGSAFQKKVWNALLKVPYGKGLSYKEVAEMIGQPQAARAVGTACGKNPLPIIVPCHRIISSDGRLGGYSGGPGIKKKLLKLEGIGYKYKPIK